MNEHRESRTTGTGGRHVPDLHAAITARGIGRVFYGPAVFDATLTGRTALWAQLELLRPRPLKVQSARTGRS